jgi:hypothetical protein
MENYESGKPSSGITMQDFCILRFLTVVVSKFVHHCTLGCQHDWYQGYYTSPLEALTRTSKPYHSVTAHMTLQA